MLADPGKDADGKHPPDAAKTVGDEGAAGVVEAWLAVQDHCGQKDNEARNATDDNCLRELSIIHFKRLTKSTSMAVQRKVMAVFETSEPMVQLTILPTGMMCP